MAKVIVGPTEKAWIISKDLLCARIPFFAAAFEGGFKEGTDNELRLPEDDAEIFAHVVDWAHGQALKCHQLHTRDVVDGEHLLHWAKLFVLADTLCIHDLASRAAVQYESCLYGSGYLMGPDEIDYIYQNTVGYWPLRKLAVNAYVDALFSPGEIDLVGWTVITSHHWDFQIDVVKGIKDRVLSQYALQFGNFGTQASASQ
jgi:hypothetical protein